MKLFVTRHGQTEWNSENRVCGITNINLTDTGIEQAKELSTKLADYKIDIIISSPLKRAKETAEIISDAIGKIVIIDRRLFEQNYGVYEGVSRNAEDFRAAKKHFSSKLSGGESLFQVAHRVYSLIEEIKEKYPNENVLFVTHGSVCRVIHSYFTDLSNEEYFEYYTGNCELKEYSL
ncbi:histidine phosphatase family protein [Paenibacillus eucommiae]|uniref:Phosphoglycerate mutase n=1 Tax=Paenibacillus eucommiae TaxID=1355755 RepID=A0ABS4IT16_9BACL|nr:histidine phosphatase family protein [Paenibacillus eucommiae]MBP1989744.1 putative phosphoglycerate mutase [Paenibacillus eucommiae]